MQQQLAIACLLCILIHLAILRVEYRSAVQPVLANLRRPTQFVGLDRVNRTFPPPDDVIVNFPFVVGLVDEMRPSEIVSNLPLAPNVHNHPGDREARKIQVTKSVSTIVQFRVLDWGMESCELTLCLPHNETQRIVHGMPKDASSQSAQRRLTDTRLRIFRLIPGAGSSDSVIDTPKLSYDALNFRREVVGSVGLDEIKWSFRFPCDMDSLHTFALVAGGDSVDVQWWQNQQILEPAVFILQHKTQ
ncbi:hypothetical protein K474DRAFT_923383 [Panus rudis PR-1116 ss-1]|nr:hypothetical protein K474DRAFT_923383 [Panus rudis PR-1116 ss-1]